MKNCFVGSIFKNMVLCIANNRNDSTKAEFKHKSFKREKEGPKTLEVIEGIFTT